ncbi:glutathione transporter ATP-binding protein [Escherichia coli]|uniref:Glutathione transporter ATP-binding protein n=1 Tax=Escherichia coli TaxID=562 RepID=A0A376RM00_ECOLX|nr:glutathione transporter ATP-binding protein [Escherichia coli]
MPHSDELDAGNVLAVENLNIAFMQDQQKIAAVRNLSFSLQRGETLAIVGESGSGKSVTALALMRLLEQAGGLVQCDKMLLQRRSREVIELSEQSAAQMRHVRGADMAMIFQEPMTSLNPVFTVGEQIAESIRLHQNASREEAMVEAKRMLDQVRIPEAQTILSRYPHQLSGGMRQRVMIAMALSCRPAVLIADEPTTALDVTIQAQILQLIKVLQKEMSMGVIFITHDMGVVAEIADRVLVMYQGEAVETGTVEQIFHAPQHPYTRALLAAVPQLGAMKGLDYPRRFPLISLEHPAKQAPPIEQKTVVDGEPVLRVRNLVTRFPLRSGLLNRVTRKCMPLRKSVLISGLAKRYRWWASLAAVNPLPGGRCCAWSNRRAAKLSLTVSESIPCHPANFRHCAGIFSLFFRTLTLRWTHVRPSVIRLSNRCVYTVYCQVKKRLHALRGCWSAWACYLNMPGVTRMSFPAVSASASALLARWH